MILLIKSYVSRKIPEMKSKRYGKLLQLHFLELPENETSYEIFNIGPIFKLRVEIKNLNQKKSPVMLSLTAVSLRCNELPHKS